MNQECFEWNEAILEEGHGLDACLISILAFTEKRSPKLIGTGFIIQVDQYKAVGLTVAHNFLGVKNVITSKRDSHPTALDEFLPNGHSLTIDSKNVRAIYRCGNHVEALVFDDVVIDERDDIAVFTLANQNKEPISVKGELLIDDHTPQIGDWVCVLGYADMKILSEEQNQSGYEYFTMQRKILLRKGRVTAIHPRGHLFTKRISIETTIPVYSGMSGGPLVLFNEFGAIKTIGMICSDLNTQDDKQDRSEPGHSICLLLNSKIQKASKNDFVEIELPAAYVIKNSKN